MTSRQLRAGLSGTRDDLFAVEWVPVPPAPTTSAGPTIPTNRWAVACDRQDLAAALVIAGADVRAHASLDTLVAAIDAGDPVPEVVLACAGTRHGAGDDVAVRARLAVADVLALVQGWLAEERLASSRLVVVTRGAVGSRAGSGGDGPGRGRGVGLGSLGAIQEPGQLSWPICPPRAQPTAWTTSECSQWHWFPGSRSSR